MPSQQTEILKLEARVAFENEFSVWNNKWVFAERPKTQNTATVQDVAEQSVAMSGHYF